MHMETANKPKQGQKLLIGAIAAFVIVGSGLSFLGTGSMSQSLMSQFSGAGNTWQSSPNNPKRTALSATYTTRIDTVVANMLSRGQSLKQSEYLTYLSSISSGMKQIGAEPLYASNADIQNIIGYIDYELTDTKTKLSSGELFFDRLIVLVGNSLSSSAGTTQTTGTTATTVTTTAGTQTTGTTATATTATATTATTTTPATPASPTITSATSVSQSSQSTYTMTWAGVSGVTYFTAIDNGSSVGGSNV